MAHPGKGFRLRRSARSNTGRVRDNNEDRVHIFGHDHTLIAIVADGMGGAVAGEEASRIAVEVIQDGFIDSNGKFPGGYSDLDSEQVADRLRKVINNANNQIVQESEFRPELKGMGTTVTMAFIRDNLAIVGHVGDSRAYLIDGEDGEIQQVTTDHSFVQALVTAGHITQEEAEDHPMGNVLYRALGQADDVDVDVYYQNLTIGDRLILCSDGLTLHVKPTEIAQIVLASKSPGEASQKLIDTANERGGRDNVSAIVVKLERIEPDQLDDFDEDASDVEFFDEDTLIIGKRPTPLDDANLPMSSERDNLQMTLEESAVILRSQRHSDIALNNSNESSIEYSGEGQDKTKQ